MSDFVINAVPADGWAPLDPRTSATKMTECGALVHKGAMFEIETQTRWVTKKKHDNGIRYYATLSLV